MKTKLVSDDPGGRIHVVILDSGEEAFTALTRFANETKIEAASVTAIGAFEKATVGGSISPRRPTRRSKWPSNARC